jgi:5-hydroxyisourate hydrolase
MSSLSTHVLDTALGKPAQGVQVRLSRLTPATPAPSHAGLASGQSPLSSNGAAIPPQPGLVQPLAEPQLAPPPGTPSLPSADPTADSSAVGSGTTDADGRISEFTGDELEPGTYQLRFDTAAYAAATQQDIFFPEVVVTFLISDERHYHVPLLLSPFAFSTYRGS